ncbi:HAD family hydrolase [Proteiniclasticum ruminis]|uniref:HAD family hydrolase n=1 Tax=Proteiniclasticum ruminis TaxID=398199 RepID=UPI0028B07962|nr:HAD family hydrolase [Proteiniclasticum ruminis]
MKKINTILFDLDGTLLSIDMKEFEEIYYTSLSNAFKSIIAPDNFMAILYSSMKAMVKNKENRTNEEVFMSVMKEHVGEELPAFQKHFIHYYENDFSVLRDAVNKNTDMLEALEILKEKGYELVIATNPLFPKFAIDQRIQWAELVHEDFSHITYFEDSHYCKPNVEYYSEILETIGKNPQECMMVGNDAEEDLAAGALGITTYLITNHLLNRKSLEYTADHEGTYKDFLMFAESMPDVQ